MQDEVNGTHGGQDGVDGVHGVQDGVLRPWGLR